MLPWLLLSGQVARAGKFQVTPVQVYLSATTTSALVTVRNESAESIRFQVTAFAWQQAPDGQIQLAPTKNVIFFPSLLTLAAGEARKLRVGTTTAPGAVEATYRIFVEELPPIAKEDNQVVNGVRVLTKMGIPVFVQPKQQTVDAHLDGLSVKKRHLMLQLGNKGNTHFQARGLKLTGRAPGSTAVKFERTVPGWYVLAGGVRDFDVELSAEECAGLGSIDVVLDAADAKAQQSVTVGSADCAQ